MFDEEALYVHQVAVTLYFVVLSVQQGRSSQLYCYLTVGHENSVSSLGHQGLYNRGPRFQVRVSPLQFQKLDVYSILFFPFFHLRFKHFKIFFFSISKSQIIKTKGKWNLFLFPNY